ncbi:MAG: exosortase W [Deltaproteobacteria bacterium]|nr:exosortase W [Deltaproteobacteria bacterium]
MTSRKSEQTTGTATQAGVASNTVSIALMGVILLLFAAIYAGPFSAMAQMWWGSDDYTHGFLVPLISLYIVWRAGAELIETPASTALKSGALVMALSGAMLVAGKAGSVVVLEELSIPLMIAGLVLVLAGPLFLKALWFPIAYLLFMIKLFGEGSEKFHWPFQLLAADIGVWAIQTLGIPAYKEAQFIQLPNITLEVASACSGLRFLVSIIAIGVPLAWLTQRSWPRRIGLVAFAVLIAILANGARVALIGVWAFYGGKVVHGPMHVLQGMFVAWIGFIALFAGVWFLSRKDGEPDRGAQLKPAALACGLLRKISSTRKSAAALITASVLLAATAVFYFSYKAAPAPLSEPLSSLPSRLGDWTATDEAADDYLKATGGSDEFSRIYRKDGTAFRVYVSYYDEQAQGREMVNYRNSWTLHRSERPVRVVTETGVSEVNVALLKRDNEKRFAMFWYQMDGRTFTDRMKVKLWTIWKAIAQRRTNGAVVILSAPDPAEGGVALLEKEAADLAGRLIPAAAELVNAKTETESR